MALAHDDVTSVAVPCISTGVFGYPSSHAARVAIRAVCVSLRGVVRPSGPLTVVFVVYDDANMRAHKQAATAAEPYLFAK